MNTSVCITPACIALAYIAPAITIAALPTRCLQRLARAGGNVDAQVQRYYQTHVNARRGCPHEPRGLPEEGVDNGVLKGKIAGDQKHGSVWMWSRMG